MNTKIEKILEILWLRSRFTSFFYQSISFKEENSIPTIGLTFSSTGAVFYYNNTFIEKIDTAELIGLMVHEMLHIVFDHNHRKVFNYKTEIKNLSQDMIINSYIKKNKKTFFPRKKAFFSREEQYNRDELNLILPKSLPVIPDSFFNETTIKDPSWEELYYWLADRKKKKNKLDKKEEKPESLPIPSEVDNSSQDNEDSEDEEINFNAEKTENENENNQFSEFGIFTDSKKNNLDTGVHFMPDDISDEKIDSMRKNILNFALMDKQSIANDRVYKDISSVIEKIEQAKQNSWENQIKSIIDYTSQSLEWDYSYTRFNRRYLANGIYSQGRKFLENEIITVAIDISSSVISTPNFLSLAFGVLESMLNKYKINLLFIDENIFIPEKNKDQFTKNSDLTKRYFYKKNDWKYIKSGTNGTTFFTPLFNDYIANHKELLIVLTDGEIYDLDKLKRYNSTLWILPITEKHKFHSPFGKKIFIQSKEVKI